jgi:hypothetical protein
MEFVQRSFSAAASSENNHGSMNFASNTAPVSLTSPSSVAAIQGIVRWIAWGTSSVAIFVALLTAELLLILPGLKDEF